MILVTETFTTVTEKSAEQGDMADSGFIRQAEPMTFRELVDAIRYGMPSSWPATGNDREWVEVDQGETRAFFEQGEREYRSFHFDQANPMRKAKYWRLAFQAAGFMRVEH